MFNTIQTKFLSVKSALLVALLLTSVSSLVSAQGRWKPKPAGVPSELQVTPYKTTMIANGTDEAVISVKIIDSKGDVMKNAAAQVTFKVSGDAKIVRISNASANDATVLPSTKPNDTTWEASIKGG